MKNFIKDFLKSFFLFLSFFSNDRGIRFIYYHDVVLNNGFSYAKIEVERFKKQMMYLADNKYKTLTFNDLNNIDIMNSKDKKKVVLISFDDGWLSNHDVVFPIMKNLNLKFNIFLEVGAISKKKDYLTWDMINEMIGSGLIGIGVHTFSHIDARLINESNIDLEIIEANSEIYKKTGVKVKDFSFPFGYYNNSIINRLGKLNEYDRLYTSDGRKICKIGNNYVIGRIGIENDDSNKTFIYKLEGNYNLYYYVVHLMKGLFRGLKDGILSKY